MPWTASDAPRFKKGMTKTQATRWARIANAVLEKTGDEGLAIRTASGSIKRKGAKK